jgi:hypothetical protein
MNCRFQSGHLLLAMLAAVLVTGTAQGFSDVCPHDGDPASHALARYDAVFVGRAVATSSG